jgi:hypothetical protein
MCNSVALATAWRAPRAEIWEVEREGRCAGRGWEGMERRAEGEKLMRRLEEVW